MGLLKRWAGAAVRALPSILWNLMVTVLLMAAASAICSILIRYTGEENNSSLVYVLTVMLIAVVTPGYFYAVAASLVAGFFTNYYFMYPYAQFSLELSGYPVTMLSMMAISVVVCTFTARLKILAEDAVQREKNTRALYELNERLNQEKAAVQLEKDREAIRNNILRAVSHDLRTPLTAISGSAAVLLEEKDWPEREASLLSGIKEDTDGLITMVENLLSVTRLQGDKAAIKKQPELLEEVAGDAVIGIRRRFPEAKIGLSVPEDVLMVPMDPILIRQVIFNLLENAVRHSGAPETVRLSLSKEGDWMVTEVSDQGGGLSAEVIEAVKKGRELSSSTSGDASRGMGIGLAVCQSIVSAHGGRFEAENDPAGGAVFRFCLPLEEEEE